MADPGIESGAAMPQVNMPRREKQAETSEATRNLGSGPVNGLRRGAGAMQK